MLFGEMTKESSYKSEIKIPDCEYHSFLELLRYIYAGHADITGETVMGVLYAATKYILPGLSDQCIQFLSREMDPTNACTILMQSYLFDQRSLQRTCLRFIDENAAEVLASDDFIQLDRNTLKMILKRDFNVMLDARVPKWKQRRTSWLGRAAQGAV